jgi:hypothetical protein
MEPKILAHWFGELKTTRNPMATFTLYFCGTECWPDEGIVDRAASGGSNPSIYGPEAGYIPAKLYHVQDETRDQRKAIMPGPGAPWAAERTQLWVPSTLNTQSAIGTDAYYGESMWDLAGHAAAKVVGIPSMGRGKQRTGDQQLDKLADRVRNEIGTEVNPPDRDKPPSHDCYHFSADQLEGLLAARQSGAGCREKVTTINAIGHSRGGTAAIMVTHELKYMFPGVGVNVFAIDPVPGTGSLSKEMVTLASNVKNYVGVYAIDEISAGFNGIVPWSIHNETPIDPLRRTKDLLRYVTLPNYHLIYAPGRHGTVAGNRTSNGKADARKKDDDMAAVGTLVSRLAIACLRAWGTQVPRPQAQCRDLAWHKQKMTDAAPKYRKMRSFTYIPGDAHSPQHWRERGVTSSEGNNPNNWEYLEDAIGEAPLVARNTRSPFYNRPDPGLVRWQAIEKIDDFVFNVGRWHGDKT